jgi:16S rRNA (guanine527-N7)-methyltransferase
MSWAAPSGGWEPLIEHVLSRICAALSRSDLAPAWLQCTRTLVDLVQMVRLWDRRVNLTAARDPEHLVDLYLADAAVLAAIDASRAPAGTRWVDVGSGGGAPGLPLAVLAPKLEVTLVEPRAKRAAFLRTALGTLTLKAVSVECRRSEQLPAKQWEVATSRATLPPDQWLREGARLARRGVWVLLARGDPPTTVDGWQAGHDLHYQWPLTGAERRAIHFVASVLPAAPPGRDGRR